MLSQHQGEDAALNASCDKGDIIAGFGIIEIREGNAGLGLLEVAGQRLDQRVARGLIIRHRRDPAKPIGLGAGGAGIEGQAVLIDLGEIAGNFVLIEFLGEEAEAKQLIPEQVLRPAL